MEKYSREFGSNYPNQMISLGLHKDVDDSVVELINEYNSYVQKNDMSTAYQFYEQNKNILNPYIINMSYINYLEEEIYNTGLYALNTSPIIYSSEEPLSASEGSYWIQEYD